MFGDAAKRLEYVGQQVQDQAGYRNFLTTVGILLYATGHDARANALLQEAQARGQAGMDLDEIIGYARPIGDTPFDKFVPWVYREFSRLAFETPDDYIAAANALASVAPHLAAWQRKTKVDLNRLRMDAVIAAIEAWQVEHRRDPALPGKIVYRFADGWTIQQLTTQAQIVSEGVSMQHCMRDPSKDYAAQVTCEPGLSRQARNIYSLRDPSGVPYVTLMQARPEGAFVEVRSVGNKAVPAQLQPYVDEFIAAAPGLKTPPGADMLGAMRTTGLTIFIDEHPDPDLGYVISSLRYAHIDDDEPIGSGPSAEADTLAQAQQIAKQIATAARKRGVADVEILVEGDAGGLGAARGDGETGTVEAVIAERDGWPDAGDYVLVGDDVYQIVTLADWIHTGATGSGAPNYVYGRLRLADWDDLPDGEEPAWWAEIVDSSVDSSEDISEDSFEGLGAADRPYHVYAADGFESAHQTQAAAHKAAERGAARRGLTYKVVKADRHGMTGGNRGTVVAVVGGRGGGLGARRRAPLNVPEQIRHGSFGPIVWLRDGTTRMATQRDMDRLPVGPDLTRAEESAIPDDL